ncbi:MAG: APC family permease [Thaumarchaeota archaeon]|nr:APC family permease [Candidatus Terraquivivens yellowstonensis]MCL7393059.1 APC family permease [Candidatus Terraquivivens yellowstonensis]
MLRERKKAVTLKRDIGWLGSFAIGYGDVGADIFLALGVVFLYAAGAAPFAFMIAAIVYVLIGLTYAELSSVYPYAGGSQVFALKGLNSLFGFLAGWALMLDYVINISLFSLAAAGYLKFLLPELYTLNLGISPLGLIAVVLVLSLLFINYIGIKYSTSFTTVLVVFGLVVEATILLLGYALLFNMETMLYQLNIFGNPKALSEVEYFFSGSVQFNNFIYGITVAIASFIGIESISQAAEETRKPYKWIPRAAKLTVLVVLLSVLLFAFLASGSVSWETMATSYENSVAVLTSKLPVIGPFFSLIVAITAFILCYASANTGVIGISRLMASMGKFRLMPRWFYHIHPVFRTPTRTLLIFGSIGALIALVGDIPFVVSLYNFGGLLSYMILMASFIRLRIVDRDVYRPWKVPLNIKLKLKDKVVELPLIGLIGLPATFILWLLVVILHPNGRLFGFIWVAIGLALYAFYRKLYKLPLISNEEGSWVVPSSYVMEVTVLVDPMEDYETIKKTILHSYDKRYKLRLLSVINHIAEKESNLKELQTSVLSDLEKLAIEFRREGYNVTYDVFLGDFEEAIRREISVFNVDFIICIRPSFKETLVGKHREETINKLSQEYPGRFMILRRLE